ncbi:hypothetical protein IP81_16255 [Novosphingobium sp. AAP83]|uniref:fumarylacetoacetase n=1 Tax=Novosphingobium sp. AAP83 TaxID=1523425 RepID=UPI0006B975EB|nr:fumarylacetoacetase [Novosphingobium sp. AAP83]KPF89817.1 hypothetical protein IP81_16255 [Novosphingobium sp. AAP83]
MSLNFTHDPAARSWVETANDPACDFPVQNLPHGVFSCQGRDASGGVAIGDAILDLLALAKAGVISTEAHPVLEAAAEGSLNRFVAMGNQAASLLRGEIFRLLVLDGAGPNPVRADPQRFIVPSAQAMLHMPLRVGSFTDFMTSVHHVTAARKARPARELNENFLHLPVAYNSRASSIVPDGVAIVRPHGQVREASGQVVFRPTSQLDFELEFGALIGPGNPLGSRVGLDQTEDMLFGYVLVNDWSARDIQIWESRLGPFLGKSFATTISPWIVTAEALAPFRVAPVPRLPGQPAPLPYLDSARHRAAGALDIRLEARLSTRNMRQAGLPPERIVATNLLHCAWTLPQMTAHHTSNGCNLEAGDLLSSGTVSGPTDEEAACLFERTAGTLPLDLPGGEQRLWLEDEDELVITGRAERDGFASIGFGPCGARIAPAR